MPIVKIKRSVTATAYPALSDGEVAHSEAIPGQIAIGTTAANDIIRTYPAADQTKLAGVAAGAQPNQTGAEIKAAYEGEANTNGFTDAEKAKLAGLEDPLWLGTFTSEAALIAAHPPAAAREGSSADVDAGAGSDTARFILDSDSDAWIQQGAAVGAETPASIKTKYESNPDTNVFLDAEKTKLSGIDVGATDDQTAAEIAALVAAEADTNFITDAEKTKIANAVVLNTHIGQTDTPAAYGGADFIVAVNATNDGLVHVDTIDGGTF